MIRVLICDDQHVVAEGLQAILSTVAQIEVVGQAHNGAEAIERVATTKPDVVLMDIKMPRVNGVQATREIRNRFLGVRVLILTTYDADEWVFDAIRAGASGYLLKDSPRESLVAAIEGTAAGKTHVDPSVAGRLFEQVAQASPTQVSPLLESLTERERQVLTLLGRGLNNAAIATQLHMAEGTLRNNVSNILGKLNLADRTQAALFALRHGLLDGKKD
jgi:DNA-binding NarL/FixJ family response regulator